MTLRLAFVLSALQAGGAERIVADLSRAAVDRGWSVTILTFDAPDDPIYHSLDPRVELLRLALPSGGRAPRALLRVGRRIRVLRRALRTGQFDVVMSFLTKINVLTLLAGRGLAVPIIVSERNNPERQNAHPLWNFILGRLYPRAAAIVMQTERSKAGLGARARERAVVIPNPARTPDFLPDPAAAPTIAAVGRLTHQKGFDLLIAAFAQIADRYPDWRLQIWGEGPDRGVLEAQVGALGLEGRVILPGISKRPGSWIVSTTIFVLSSRYEGWPNVLAEALGAGLPAVAFDCDFGPAELIVTGDNGVLVEAEDICTLAYTISQLIDCPDVRRQLGEKARLSMSRYDARLIEERCLLLIEGCARKRSVVNFRIPFGIG